MAVLTSKNLKTTANLVSNCHSSHTLGADLGGGCRGCAPSPEMTRGFLIQLVFCKKKKKKNYVVYLC